MAFTDVVLQETPQLDSGRLGVLGGSYGGFMTNWIITQTDRFQAAASQRSVANWTSDFGTSCIGYTFDPNEMQTTPWKDVMTMWKASPLAYANRVKTPTLFIHSLEDYNCPLSEGLQNQVNLLSYAMRQTLIRAFHLDAGQLQPAQQELLSSIRQGIPDFQSYRHSCKRDTAYLLDTWRALCQSREEDSEAWLEFLNHKHWTKDTVDELTAEKILALEMKKCYAHSSAVAGKIYSFLHIRDHLAQDPAQTYAKLKELLSKDASFTQQNFISWRNHVQKQALQFFELSHEDKGAEVWEEWLHKQSLDKADLYLLERLSYYAKRHHYKKEVRNLLFSYFELETADTPAKQSLRKAILEEPPAYRRKKQMLLLLALLAALSAVLIPALLGRAQEQRKAEDRKQEELRNIQQEMLEESQRKSQLEALQKKIEAGNQ